MIASTSEERIRGCPEARQLILFPWRNPLTERFGREFSLGLPRLPGTYLMRDRERRVVYVGQSKNLRHRLSSYRYVRPGTASRRVLRLVARVASIEYQVCADAIGAQLRENVLLRQYRPLFNRANTHPESHLFVSLVTHGSNLIFSYSTRQDDVAGKDGRRVFGAYKSLPARRGLAALYRLFWFQSHLTANRHQLPCHLTGGRPPRPHSVPLEGIAAHPDPRRLRRKIYDFFEGKSEALVHRLCGKSGERYAALEDHWLRAILEEDHVAVTAFFNNGPNRNRALKENNHIGPKRVIQQAQLDDLIVAAPGILTSSASG